MFINFYSQLVCCMSAKALAPHFVTENIISDQDHEEILNVTSRIKARDAPILPAKYLE